MQTPERIDSHVIRDVDGEPLSVTVQAVYRDGREVTREYDLDELAERIWEDVSGAWECRGQSWDDERIDMEREGR